MSSTFEFNEDGFRRLAEEAVANVAAQQTRDLDELRQRLAGEPVETIKPELQRLFASYDGNVTESDLTDWAQLISDNTRIEMTPAAIDWEAIDE